MANSINKLTIEEFQKHFNRLPVNYKSRNNTEYVTFITTLSIFNQIISAEDKKSLPHDKLIGCIDKEGNLCKMLIRKYNDPEEDFKMIAVMFNTTTGERIALIAA